MFVLRPDTNIIEFLRSDGWIQEDEESNITHAERAFVANAAVKHFLGKFARKEVQEGNLFTFFNILEKFKKGELSLSWKDGELFIIKND